MSSEGTLSGFLVPARITSKKPDIVPYSGNNLQEICSRLVQNIIGVIAYHRQRTFVKYKLRQLCSTDDHVRPGADNPVRLICSVKINQQMILSSTSYFISTSVLRLPPFLPHYRYVSPKKSTHASTHELHLVQVYLSDFPFLQNK